MPFFHVSVCRQPALLGLRGVQLFPKSFPHTGTMEHQSLGIRVWTTKFGQMHFAVLTPVIQEKQKYRVTKHHGDVPAIGTVFFWLRKLTSPFSSQGGQAGCLWPCPCCGYVGWLGSGWEEALLLRAFHSQLLSEENVQGFSWPKCRAVAGTVSSWPHFGAGLGFGLLSSLPYPRFLDRTGWEVLRR